LRYSLSKTTLSTIYEQNLRYQPKSKPLGTFYFTFCPRSNGVFLIAKIRAYSLYTKHYNSYFVYFYAYCAYPKLLEKKTKLLNQTLPIRIGRQHGAHIIYKGAYGL